jgi:ABC-2 type transport system permease protein
VRTYVELTKAEFRRYSTYRAATLAGIITNSVFGFIRLGVLLAAIAAAGGTLGGYSPQEASTYVWLGQASWRQWLCSRGAAWLSGCAPARSRLILPDRWTCNCHGVCATSAALRSRCPLVGLGPLLVGALTVGVAFSETWTSYPLGILSLLLAISVSFICRYGLNLIAFWTVDVQGFLNLYTLMLGLLSGFYLPVHVFPGWLQPVAFASPFPAMFQAPIDVMSGRVVGDAAWQVIAGQASWMIGLVVLTRVVLSRATWRLVVQGG